MTLSLISAVPGSVRPLVTGRKVSRDTSQRAADAGDALRSASEPRGMDSQEGRLLASYMTS